MSKLILALFLLISIKSFSQVSLTKDTALANGSTWNLAGQILRSNGHLISAVSGTASVSNAIIVNDDLYTQIFDTTINIKTTVSKLFSARWYGAKPGIDNYKAFQMSINTCINTMDLFIPRGVYDFSKNLIVANFSSPNYSGATLNMYGESNLFFDGTVLNYTGVTAWAIGYQFEKGGYLRNIKLVGQFIPPATGSTGYFSITQDNFNDVSARCSANYTGIVIDYDGTANTGGSSGFEIDNVWVTNFDRDIVITRNFVTGNGDALHIGRVRLENCRVGYQSTQAQEKGNIIDFLMSWGNTHTVLSIGVENKGQAGQYAVNGGNIQGAVRYINVNTKGWFGTNISNVYCENIGQVGVALSGDQNNNPILSFIHCDFEFAYPNVAGAQTLLTTNNNTTTFERCNFRYYGDFTDTLHFAGISHTAIFINCDWTSPKSGIPFGGTIVYPLTTIVNTSVKVTKLN